MNHEITEPVPEIALGPDQHGLALLLRRDDRPVGFFVQPFAPSTRLSPIELADVIGAWCGVGFLEDSLREELIEPFMPSSRQSVTIAICTRDHPDLLAECLESLAPLRDNHGKNVLEILVIDNAPAGQETNRLVQSLRGIRYLCEPIPGLDFARNRALAEATTDFVAFLDDDVVIDRRWWEGLNEALAQNPDAAVVTGLVLPRELETDAQIIFERRGGFRRGFSKLLYNGDHLPGNPLYPTGAGMFGAGCNMVVNREVALGLGGFDEALDTGPSLPGGGDIDMFYRVLRAGRPLVYEPRMLVFHKHRREMKSLRRQYWTWGTGFMAFVAKTRATDPSQRRKLRHLLRWWLVHQMNELRHSFRGRNGATPRLVSAEIVGGLVGLAGTYQRSARRVQRIRGESR
jgi:GT2 family glycosyltransferase